MFQLLMKVRFSSTRNTSETQWDRGWCQRRDFFQFNPNPVTFTEQVQTPTFRIQIRTGSFQAFGGGLSPKLYFLKSILGLGWVVALWHVIAETHFFPNIFRSKTKQKKKRFSSDWSDGGVMTFHAGDQRKMLKSVFHLLSCLFLFFGWTSSQGPTAALLFWHSGLSWGGLFETGMLCFWGAIRRKIHCWAWLPRLPPTVPRPGLCFLCPGLTSGWEKQSWEFLPFPNSVISVSCAVRFSLPHWCFFSGKLYFQYLLNTEY